MNGRRKWLGPQRQDHGLERGQRRRAWNHLRRARAALRRPARPQEDRRILESWVERCDLENFYDSNVQRPPAMVRSMGILISVEGSSLNGSRPSTTRSASFPASMEPFRFSSYEA